MTIIMYGRGGELDRWDSVIAFVSDVQRGLTIFAGGDRIEFHDDIENQIDQHVTTGERWVSEAAS